MFTLYTYITILFSYLHWFYLHTADFIKNVLGVYTYSMKTIYLFLVHTGS